MEEKERGRHRNEGREFKVDGSMNGRREGEKRRRRGGVLCD